MIILLYDDEDQCACRYPADNDQGFCLSCCRWINYKEREDTK